MNYLVIILSLILTCGCASYRNETDRQPESNNKTANDKVAVIEDSHQSNAAKAECLSESNIKGASDSAFSKKNNDPLSNDPLGIEEVVKRNGKKIAQKFRRRQEIIDSISQPDFKRKKTDYCRNNPLSFDCTPVGASKSWADKKSLSIEELKKSLGIEELEQLELEQSLNAKESIELDRALRIYRPRPKYP